MSPRGRNKFLFAGFGRISLTRLLDLQSKTGKKQAFFAQNSPFAQCFMGDFYFLGLSGPEILPPGRENPGPGKEIPGPGIFFPGPVFSRRRPGSPFSRYLELFHRQIPDVNMSAQAPPGLRAPAIPARKQPRPRQKEILHPCLPTFGFPHVPRDCVFCARRRPLPRTSESQRPSNDKVSTSKENSKMSNPPQRPAGKHEIVPRYILLLLFLLTRFLRIILEKHPCNLLKIVF